MALLPPSCGGMQFSDIRDGIETRGHVVRGVPFTPQKTGGDCGPASLTSVFLYWERPADTEEIAARIYLAQLGGTLTMDMERFARSRGFQAASPAGSLDELKTVIRQDIPVICLLDLGFGPYRQPHYVTVIGFDDGNRMVIVHDGRTPNRLMPYGKFDRAWARAGRWMLVITPKESKEAP